MIEKLGVDILVFENFNKTFASMSPEKFVRDILIDKLKGFLYENKKKKASFRA